MGGNSPREANQVSCGGPVISAVALWQQIATEKVKWWLDSRIDQLKLVAQPVASAVLRIPLSMPPKTMLCSGRTAYQ